MLFFQPRKSRSISPFPLPTSQSIVFRPDAIFMLLRKAFIDNDLGAVCKVVMHSVFLGYLLHPIHLCRCGDCLLHLLYFVLPELKFFSMLRVYSIDWSLELIFFQASKILHYLAETTSAQEESSFSTRETSSLLEEEPGSKSYHVALSEYSELFGDQFLVPMVDWNPSYISVLDIGAVEEGILHVLYACASQVSWYQKYNTTTTILILFCCILTKFIDSRCFAASWQKVLLTFGWRYLLYKHCYQVSCLVNYYHIITFMMMGKSASSIYNAECSLSEETSVKIEM